MEPPSFSTTGPQVVRAAPGSDASLVLPLPSGSPPFHYEWSRAGVKLDDRFKTTAGAGGVRLTISSVSTGDSGVYTLQASNAAGKDTTRVRLEVSPEERPTGEDPPTFLRRLQDLTVKVGTRTRFLVEIISSTECRVTWYRNERRLLEAERIALVRDGNFWCADISAVSVDDAGRWTCTAENVGGRASCSAHLNVLVPKAYKRPEFVEELRALLTEQGTVSLECKVVGVPTPVLRWFKDSREIKAGDVFALTANAEDPTSLGTYTCEAVNCMGRAYSSSKVHVIGRASREGSARPASGGVALEPPPIFTKELEDQFVRICEPLTLSCNIVVPPWPRSIVWYNKEGKIEPSEKHRVLEDGVGGYLLEVPSAEWPDEGEWKCVATSSGGRIGITTCYVSMDVPKNYRKPRFMENLQAVLTEEGLVSFECKVVGFPTPVLSWFKDGQELKPGDVYQLTGTNSLGSYCCIARNCMGQASSSAELTVEDIQNQLNDEEKLQLFSKNQAPKFLQGLKSVEAKIDEPFRFTIKVAIPPEPTVLWYRDDQPVDDSSRCQHGKEERGIFFLDIQSLEFMDQAEWKCVAMNDFGHSVTSCFLKLIIPRHYKKPRFLENLQAILSEEGAVNLECKVIGVPQPVLKWYKDGEELKPGDIHRIISGQDGTCCLGTYTCEAQNCMGIAASSASLLGFEDSINGKGNKKVDEQTLQRNLSLSTIHEERTSQMYDTPVGDITLDDKGEISFSFDGKEVSVSLYETPDLTEEEALQIVEMYADQLSENVTEHNVIELPPLRFVKETSTSGNLLMEAIIIDVSPEYFTSPEEDLRTEADVEDISIADENGPLQLSLDHEVDGEDYLEKTMELLSDEKADFPIKADRKKSDSQKSADDYFSLSRDQSLSEDKKDDDTQALSESDLQSFASARSSGKVKSKSSKPSIEDGQESSDVTKTVFLKEDLQNLRQQNEIDSEMKSKRERRSRSLRKSSSDSEKSFNKMKEDVLDSNFAQTLVETTLDQEKIKAEINTISSTLTKLINDVQMIERDIILKSELMSTAATASRSLEIINSLITPLSEIHSIAEAIKETVSESHDVTTSLFNRLPQSLSILHQSLTFIEKCIDLESENKTLVKKTCSNIIEKCADELNQLIKDISSIVNKECPFLEGVYVSSIQTTNNEILNTITSSVAVVKECKKVSDKLDTDLDKATPELKHLQKTQKAVYELRNPLNSLLNITEAVDISSFISAEYVTNTQIILNDMSTPIQALQNALEYIEFLSVTETQMGLEKYNTEIMETVMDSVIKLRTSFEQLSVEAGTMENVDVLETVLVGIKHNINEIFAHLDMFEAKIGPFDVLNSENKLEALQKMAQILINLENNLVILDIIPCLKLNMADFHKNLTKVLEHVIESNDAKKYFNFLDICDGVNKLNTLIKNMDSNDILSLAGINNNLKIIQTNVKKNEFTPDLNFSILSNITDLLVTIHETMNHADTLNYSMISENIEDLSIRHYEEGKLKIVLEQIEKAISTISTVVSLESTKDLDIKQALNKIIPTLEEIKYCVASLNVNVNEQEENISDMSNFTFTQAVANPLCELNLGISVLNQIICEKASDCCENELKVELATPLLELRNALEILQQDVISQNGENVNTFNILSNVANAVQSIKSCMLMIQEPDLLENVDDLSTLDDISAIKTSADILSSDHLLSPTVFEVTTEMDRQVTNALETQVMQSVSAKILRDLNDHILSLQRPEIMETLDALSKHDAHLSIKSMTTGIDAIHNAIENILHPISLEDPQKRCNFINPTQLSTIIQPVQELHQCLSVIDIEHMPLESAIKMDQKIFLSQYLSKLEHCLRDSIDCLHVAIEITDVTLDISLQVDKLRKLCVNLKNDLEIAKNNSIIESSEFFILDDSLNAVLDTTNCSQDINIATVKLSLERLQQNIAIVQDEIFGFTVENPLSLRHETKILKSVADIDSTIASLAQLQFVDIGQVSEVDCCVSQQVGKEVNCDQVNKIENIVETIENCIQQLPNNNYASSAKNFIKIFNDEIALLCCLFNQKPTPKRIIKMFQLFYELCQNLKQFQLHQEKSYISEDFNGWIATLKECLKSVQALLLAVLDSQSDLIFNIPISNITNIEIILNEILESNENTHLHHFVKLLMNTIESIKPWFKTIQADVIKELQSCNVNLTADDDTDKNFALVYKYLSEKTKIKDDKFELDFEAIFKVIQKHEERKHIRGTGKKIVLIKCISDCLNILKPTLNALKNKKRVLDAESTSDEYDLKKLLMELSGPIEIFHKKIMNICNENLQITDKSYILKDLELLESQADAFNIAKVAEKLMECENLFGGIFPDCSSITLAKDLVIKIHSIKNSIENLKSAYSIDIDNILNIQLIKEIEKILTTWLSAVIPEDNRQFKVKTDSLLQHMEQYIEIIEIVEEVSAVIKLEDLKKSAEIVRELRESITSETSDINFTGSNLNISEEQKQLAQNLKKALTTLQIDTFDCEQELAPLNNDDIRQQIIEVVSDLQNDLVALTSPYILGNSALLESDKQIDQNVSVLIQEGEGIANPLKETENEQYDVVDSERNLEESLAGTDLSIQCNIPVILEVEETQSEIEVSSTQIPHICDEKQPSELKSDIDLSDSEIQELSEIKFNEIQESFLQHINDYLCQDIIEDLIKKLLPSKTFEQLEQSHQIAVEIRDNTILKDSNPLAQQVLIKKQLELVLKLQEVILAIHEKNLYNMNEEILQSLIGQDSLQTAKSVVQNLFHSIQMYLVLLNTIIQTEGLIMDSNILVKQSYEEKSSNSTISETNNCDKNISINENTPLEVTNKKEKSKQEMKHETNNNAIFDEDNNFNSVNSKPESTSVVLGNEHINDELKIDNHTDIEKSNAVLELETLLQEVNETVHLSENYSVIQNSVELQDLLEEVQTVILKLKCDFDGSTNDTLNEYIEDLECNVRSVQLQINENSPPSLLEEACANLQTLAVSINNTYNTQNISSTTNNTLCVCTNDAEQAIELLDKVSCSKVDVNLDNIILNLNDIKETMKSLKSCFMDDTESLILKGIEVLQHLDHVEDKVFALEKELEANNEIDVIFRDSIIAATHSVYGSISNMRGNLRSIQKKYLYDNYGQPSDNFLKSIKNVYLILNYDKKDDWKQFVKSLRKILKHFEDVKFYINFDKTARLPSDSAFTKIILGELSTVLSVVVLQNTKDLDYNLTDSVEGALNYVNQTLNSMENRTTLEVKEKIPIFKELSIKMIDITSTIKNLLQKKIYNINQSSVAIEELSEKEENIGEKSPSGAENDDNRLINVFKAECTNVMNLVTENNNDVLVNKETSEIIQDRDVDAQQLEELKNIEELEIQIIGVMDINRHEKKDMETYNNQVENKISIAEPCSESIVAIQSDDKIRNLNRESEQDMENDTVNQDIEIRLRDSYENTTNIDSGSVKITGESKNVTEEINVADTKNDEGLAKNMNINNSIHSKNVEDETNKGKIEIGNISDENNLNSDGLKNVSDIISMQGSIEKESNNQMTTLEIEKIKENVVDEEISTAYSNQYEDNNITLAKQQKDSEKNAIYKDKDDISNDIELENDDYISVTESVEIKNENEMTIFGTENSSKGVDEERSSICSNQYEGDILEKQTTDSKNHLDIATQQFSEIKYEDIRHPKKMEEESKNEETSNNEMKVNEELTTKDEIDILIDKEASLKVKRRASIEKLEETVIDHPGITSSETNGIANTSQNVEKVEENKFDTTMVKPLTIEDSKKDIAQPVKQQNQDEIIPLDSLQYKEQKDFVLGDVTETTILESENILESRKAKEMEEDIHENIESVELNNKDPCLKNIKEDLLIEKITDVKSSKLDGKMAEAQIAEVSEFPDSHDSAEIKDDSKIIMTENITDIVSSKRTDLEIIKKKEEDSQYNFQEVETTIKKDNLIEYVTDTERSKINDKVAEIQVVELSESLNSQCAGLKENSERNIIDTDLSESTNVDIIKKKEKDIQGYLLEQTKELDINDKKIFEEVKKETVGKVGLDNTVEDGQTSKVDIDIIEYDKIAGSEFVFEERQKDEHDVEKMRQSDIIIEQEKTLIPVHTAKTVEITPNRKTEDESKMISTECKLEDYTKEIDNEVITRENDKQIIKEMQNALENTKTENKIDKAKIMREASEGQNLLDKSMMEDKEKVGLLLEKEKDISSVQILKAKNDEEKDKDIVSTSKTFVNVEENVNIHKIVSQSEESEMICSYGKEIAEIVEIGTENENQLAGAFDHSRVKTNKEDYQEIQSDQNTFINNNKKDLDKTKEIKCETEETGVKMPLDLEHSEEVTSIKITDFEIQSDQNTFINNNKKDLDKTKEIKCETEETGVKMPLDLEQSEEVTSIKITDFEETALLAKQSDSKDLEIGSENKHKSSSKDEIDEIEPKIKSECEMLEIQVTLLQKETEDAKASDQNADFEKEMKDVIAPKQKTENINKEQNEQPLKTSENVEIPDSKFEKQEEKPNKKTKKTIRSKNNDKKHAKKQEEAKSQNDEMPLKSKLDDVDKELTEKKDEVEQIQYAEKIEIKEENENNDRSLESLEEQPFVQVDKNIDQKYGQQNISEEILLNELKINENNIIDSEQCSAKGAVQETEKEESVVNFQHDQQQQKTDEENEKDKKLLQIEETCSLDEKEETERNPNVHTLMKIEYTAKPDKMLEQIHLIETEFVNVQKEVEQEVEQKQQLPNKVSHSQTNNKVNDNNIAESNTGEKKIIEQKQNGKKNIDLITKEEGANEHPRDSQKQQNIIETEKNDKSITKTDKERRVVNEVNEYKTSKPVESLIDRHISLVDEDTGTNKLLKTENSFTEFQVDKKHSLAQDNNLHGRSASDELQGTVRGKNASNSLDIQENILSRSENNLDSEASKHKEIKQRPSFIERAEPDYGQEFARPPGYTTKTFDIDNSPMEIKSTSKSPTMYRAQTLVNESQLHSFLPPYIDQRSNISEGRTELKQRSSTTTDSRSTISEKRGSYPRDFKRKPVFSTHLTDRTAVESSRVKLTCSVLSSTDPEISWYKNGVLLDNKHKFRTKYVDGLITLEILSAVPSDSGEYSCTVKNENGSITSCANLKVYPGFEASPIPPTFTRSIRDIYHLLENELVLECRIRGQPLPTITWLKDNRPIILNERYQAHYLADGVCRLTIISPNEDDSGKYTCKAENSMWSDQITHEVYFTSKDSRHIKNIETCENIRINRQAAESRRPHFTNVLSDHKVVSGGTIGLQVEISGSPTRVEWLREGRSVTEIYRNAQTYIDRGLYTLALSDVTEKESGLYTCRAWSTYGNVDMNASITVVQPNQFEGKPATIISRPVKDLLISVGEDLNISFRVQGEPKPKVFFMKGIRDITNSQRVCKMTSDDYVKFTLKRSVISDAGTYCVFVRNAYGCDRAFVTVVIRQRASSDHLISDWTYPMDDLAISVVDRNYQSVPDRIPSEPSTVDGGNNWVSLAWPKPVSQVKAPILAYKVESWLLGKEGGARWVELGITPRNCFDAFNLKQGEEYHFRVTPRNRYGWGESVQTSTPIGIGVAGDRPEFIEILPGQLKVLVGETATLCCTFKGNPTPEIVWMKNGHEVEEEMERVVVKLNNNNSSLQITDVKIEDEGRYSCEATNIHGRSSTYCRMAVITDKQIWAADAKLKRERSAGTNGEYPPQFTMRLRDRRVQATYPVRLTCQVIGSPSPIVTWFKDGEEVSVDSRRTTSQDEYFYTLEIAPTTLDDGGVYEAMARNGCGAISCRCNLVVDKGIRAYIAPEFCCGFEPLYRVCEGDELRISAVVEAYPSVGVTWYRDGVRLRPSRRAIMTLDRDGQIELALASVAARDAGVYTCTASNEVGRASTSGKVEVVKGKHTNETPKVPPIVVSPDLPYSKEPMFIKKPRSSEAREGDTVIIECEVIGDPKPEVYWLRDFLKPDYYRDASHFKRVGAGPAYRFEIPHAKFDYTGTYSIIAKNIHGEAKAIISLQILAKDSTCSDDTHNIRYGRVEVIPRFDKELTDLLCYDGDAIEFECRVSGNPEPDIKWFHYTEMLPDCPDFETSYDLGTARLKIKQVTAEDEGTYICEASNNLGKATSSACLVIYPPGEPNTLSQRLRRPPALLSASSTPRSTPRTTPARSLSRTPGPDLRRLGSPSREIAPKFYTYPYNRVVEEGDTVVFQCAVKGLPPPWATWDKDGIIITPTARISIREKDDMFRILEIEQVTIEDVGLYRVTLENDYGRAEASARLEVISQTGKFHGSRSYSVSPRKCLPYRRRTPSLTRQD